MGVRYNPEQGCYANAPAPPPRKPSVGKGCVIAIVLMAFGTLLVVALAIGSSKGPRATSSVPHTSAMQGPDISASSPEPAIVVTPSGPASVIAEGQYEVGVDVVAGKYRTAGPNENVTGMCYVERARNASGELGAIISNDLVRGPKTITIKVGEFVTNTDCQTFEKIG